MSDAPPFEGGAIRAVAFDAYGTLFRFSDHEHRLAAAEMLAEQGLEADLDAFAESLKKSFQHVSPWGDHKREDGSLDRDYMLAGPVPGWISTWEIWRRQFAHTFEEYALAGDATAAANRLRGVLSESEPYPDAHDAIEAIAATGLLVGLLSNADEDFLQSAISRARLRFSVIQSSESLRAYKPNRAVFQAMCNRLHCAPAEVLYVGDSPQADVHGAQHAGLRTAWVRRSESTEYPDDIPRADIEVGSLLEVAAALGIA
ncbi:MAG: HAD-IA family hydrolase [Chloroflexi bacterium]|nr:HAD-IA family hydrolase [Chloroflexota bacterium]